MLDRIFGLSCLVVQTAGNSTPHFREGEIPGLSAQTAEKLREELTQRIEKFKRSSWRIVKSLSLKYVFCGRATFKLLYFRVKFVCSIIFKAFQPFLPSCYISSKALNSSFCLKSIKHKSSVYSVICVSGRTLSS